MIRLKFNKMDSEKVESPYAKKFKQLVQNDSNFTNCVNIEIQNIAQEIEQRMKTKEAPASPSKQPSSPGMPKYQQINVNMNMNMNFTP
jgi:hypothetical protein